MNVRLAIIAIFSLGLYLRWKASKELDMEWDAIGRPEYFFNEPNVIHFFYDNQDLGHFAPKAFYASIDATNAFLQQVFLNDYRSKPKLKDLQDMAKLALNHFHTIVFQLPSDQNIMTKMREQLGRLRYLLGNVILHQYHDRSLTLPLVVQGISQYPMFTEADTQFNWVDLDVLEP